MSGHVLRFSDATHQEVEGLLPWFVNKTLDDEEQLLVEEHVRDCARCQRELDWLSGLAKAYVHSEISPDATSSFNELRPRLQNNPVWPRVLAWLTNLYGLGRRAMPSPAWIMAFEMAVIVVLGGLLATGREPAALYRTLGATPALPYASGHLVVVFEPSVTEQNLRRMVREIGARVVDGPTKADAYVLELPAGREAAGLKILRAEPAVTLAEQLEAGSGP